MFVAVKAIIKFIFCRIVPFSSQLMSSVNGTIVISWDLKFMNNIKLTLIKKKHKITKIQKISHEQIGFYLYAV